MLLPVVMEEKKKWKISRNFLVSACFLTFLFPSCVVGLKSMCIYIINVDMAVVFLHRLIDLVRQCRQKRLGFNSCFWQDRVVVMCM